MSTARICGATPWWARFVLRVLLLPGIDDRHHPGSLAFLLGAAMLTAVVGCVVVGVGLEWRDRRREGRGIVG